MKITNTTYKPLIITLKERYKDYILIKIEYPGEKNLQTVGTFRLTIDDENFLETFDQRIILKKDTIKKIMDALLKEVVSYIDGFLQHNEKPLLKYKNKLTLDKNVLLSIVNKIVTIDCDHIFDAISEIATPNSYINVIDFIYSEYEYWDE